MSFEVPGMSFEACLAARYCPRAVGEGFDSGLEAEPPVRCAAPGCTESVTLPTAESAREGWASFKGEGTFWFCPRHKDQAEKLLSS